MQIGFRFIPAYAGNSRDKVVKNISITVHPRLRGELKNLSANVRCFIGSSPLTRGTLNDNGELVITSRFIPAYAGNSLKSMPGMLDLAVHPRLRGELGEKVVESINRLRFIPAYAGNSASVTPIDLTKSVHPRLRGELPWLRRFGFPKCGSSPLTRGTRAPLVLCLIGGRFIPAYAGNSS